jgi:hypothetical protein
MCQRHAPRARTDTEMCHFSGRHRRRAGGTRRRYATTVSRHLVALGNPLEGSSQSGVLEADATCAPRYLFQAMRGTDKVVTKQQTVATWGCQLSETFPAGSAAFAFLEGIQGKFSFDTDAAFVRYSPSLADSNRFSVTACQPVRAFARSMRVGDPVHPALFMNTDGFIGDISIIGDSQVVGNPDRMFSIAFNRSAGAPPLPSWSCTSSPRTSWAPETRKL